MKKHIVNKVFSFLVLFLLVTSACGQNSAIAAEHQTSDFDNPTESSSAERTAQISELEGEVTWRASQNASWQTAEVGTELQVGYQVRTGQDGRATIVFTEGSIARVIPNSIFSMQELSGDTENPATTLELIKGQVFVIINSLLGNGHFEVETSSGVASVRGSMLSIRVTPSGRLIVTCLEGHCSLGNLLGLVSLVQGQQAEISGLNLPPNLPSAIQDYQLNAWFLNNPDAVIVALDQNVITSDYLPPGCDWVTGVGCTPENFCQEFPDDPTCNPDFCNNFPDDPICTANFCLDFPDDPVCNPDFCTEFPDDPICSPDFCTEFPGDPACDPEFCINFPDDPFCTANNCFDFPNDPVCNPNFCLDFPGDPICNPNFCIDFPDDPICNPNFCIDFPNDPFCSPDFCTEFPNDPVCNQNFCIDFPNDPFCAPDFCTQNPTDPSCTPNFCTQNPTDPSCAPDFCTQNPTDPSCTPDFCTQNPTDPSCTPDFCTQNPTDPSCGGPPPDPCEVDPTSCPPPPDPCEVDPTSCPPPPDPCEVDPTSCPPPPDPCEVDPTSCPPPPDPCEVDPESCPPPPPPPLIYYKFEVLIAYNLKKPLVHSAAFYF